MTHVYALPAGCQRTRLRFATDGQARQCLWPHCWYKYTDNRFCLLLNYYVHEFLQALSNLIHLPVSKSRGLASSFIILRWSFIAKTPGGQKRDEMKPSIEAATKMAKILEVSLDWLVGNTDAELDTATLNRIQDISKLSQKDKELVFEFLDSFISNRKIKNVLH
jgi:hypothetical protein